MNIIFNRSIILLILKSIDVLVCGHIIYILLQWGWWCGHYTLQKKGEKNMQRKLFDNFWRVGKTISLGKYVLDVTAHSSCLIYMLMALRLNVC